ncbi:ParB/RepB/Spo0J family partition protein [Paraburkholderia sp. HD33-4]|uniref:ParB/RepB/Spo0J family partition protein n=1 Tax=Paraburkholderia sp. HD33-4 TaxID=2883242 RepID=UPI001F18F391|nr:ParB/RepB/Spo0J family partition protein [Paraburkholderia sp. HD33-4]
MSLRDKLAAKNAAIAAATESGRGIPRPPVEMPRTAPGRLLEAMPMLAEKEKEVEALAAELATMRERLENASNAGADLPLDQLVEITGRRRKMSKEKFVELRENLRHNKLIHPVVVRRIDDGRYEIVSGHHRVDAYREIGREAIRSVIIEGSDDEATDGAFNANLMQSGLTDYEKYLGFKIKLERTQGMTQAKLAELSGLSTTLMSYIFSFDQLPVDVLSMVEEKPDLLGATAVAALAGYTKDGKSEQVTAAVKRLAAGEIDQGQAVKLAAHDPSKAKKPAPTPVTEKIKQGKSLYCEIRRAGSVLRLNFQTDEEAERIQAALRRVLEEESKAKAAVESEA